MELKRCDTTLPRVRSACLFYLFITESKVKMMELNKGKSEIELNTTSVFPGFRDAELSAVEQSVK